MTHPGRVGYGRSIPGRRDCRRTVVWVELASGDRLTVEGIMTKTRWWQLLAALLALTVLAAACGDSDDDAGDESGDGAEEAATEDTAADGEGESEVTLVQGEGSLLEAVQERGTLRCGVSGAAVAFSETQADGSVTGFDADFCRALAAAVIGDANAVEFTALTAAERFTALSAGDVDVLFRNTTWTQSRDTDLALDFGPTTYYDGQQVMGRASDGFSADSTIADLEGAVVCTNAGTTTELNISEATAAEGVTITLNTFEDFEIVMEQFLAGSCDVVTTDGSGLVGNKAQLQPEGEEWFIFPGQPISKEPLGPAYVQNDSIWADVVNWLVYALIIADEKGVTSANAAEMAATPPDDEVARLLGGEGELQTVMGLPADAWLQAISQVGNYDEIYEANLVPVGLTREGSFNAPFTEGGLIYANPAR